MGAPVSGRGDLRIQALTPGTHDGWTRLRHKLWPELSVHEHETEARRLLAGWGPQPYVVFLAQTAAGEIVGFVEVSTRPYAEGCESSPVAFLEGWYVEPAHRGAGIGRALVEACEDWARRNGLGELASDTDLDNETSAAIHGALGFREVAQLRCFRKTLGRR